MRGRSLFFHMPQPAAPAAPAEQSPVVDVTGVLREHIAFTAAARAETRLVRHELREVLMKVSELSGKVDTLISVATTIKQAADGQPAASLPGDDPEVQALGDRIDRAIAVLQGNAPPAVGSTNVGSSGLNGSTTDPNAPA